MSKYKISEEQAEQIGNLADTCLNYLGASYLPLAAAKHVEHMREGFEGVARDLQALYVSITDENPWEEAPDEQ